MGLSNLPWLIRPHCMSSINQSLSSSNKIKVDFIHLKNNTDALDHGLLQVLSSKLLYCFNSSSETVFFLFSNNPLMTACDWPKPRVRHAISPSYGLLVNLPFVLQPYTSTLIQAVPYAFHSNALILNTWAMIASCSLFVTTELSSLFPCSAYEKYLLGRCLHVYTICIKAGSWWGRKQYIILILTSNKLLYNNFSFLWTLAYQIIIHSALTAQCIFNWCCLNLPFCCQFWQCLKQFYIRVSNYFK